MAIGQGGYKGNLDEIMESLGPQSDQGKFFKDYIDYKGVSAEIQDRPLTQTAFELGLGNHPLNLAKHVGSFPSLSDFLNVVKGSYRTPQFGGHKPFLDAPVVSAVAGPVDTALTLGSDLLTGSVSGLEGVARGFSLDEGGWPVWSGAEAADAIEHRAANFPTYHPQTTMGRDVQSGIGAFMEGWMGHVADPWGEAVQSAAEFAGVPEESAIKWGATTSGAVGAAPMALPLFGRRRTPSDKPMYEGGYDAKSLSLGLEDQIGIVKNFQFMSDAWRKINPEAWRAALEREVTEPGHFAREIERIQDVVTQDLKEVSFFIDEYATTEGLRIGEGLPKETFSNFISRLRREGNDVRMGYGQTGRDVALDPLYEVDAGGYFHPTNRRTPLFTRDATGRMLPNWGRGYPYNHPLGRQRHIVIGEEYPAINNRWTPKHEWTHALDDILYSRLARETTSLDNLPNMASPNIGMVPDYTGYMRWVPHLARYNRATTMMSDLSPVLKDFSNKIVEVEWQKLVYKERRNIEYEVKHELMEKGAPEKRAEQIAKRRADKDIKRYERDKHKHIEDKIWSSRSPLELRGRLTGVNDFLALANKKTYDKLQNPTGTRKMTVEDLWTSEIPARIKEVRNMIDDLVAYDVMTRSEATAYLKKVLDEVREPYTKLTTELKVGPGPGLLYGGEE